MRYKVEWGFGAPEWMPLKDGEIGGCIVTILDGDVKAVVVPILGEFPQVDSSSAFMAIKCCKDTASSNPAFRMPPDGEYSFGWWHDAVTWATKRMPIYHEPPKCMTGDLRVGEPFIHDGDLHITMSTEPDSVLTMMYAFGEIKMFNFGTSEKVQPLGPGGWFKVEVLP